MIGIKAESVWGMPKEGETIYSAIIGDIVSSRTLENRSEAQAKLKKLVLEGNERFAGKLAARFAITQGDEFEVLLSDLSVTYQVIEFAREVMAPFTLTFGVGFGPVEQIEPGSAAESDGEAFHTARAAVLRAKKKRPMTVLQGDVPALALMNALVFFIESCQGRVTKRQREVLSLMLRHKNQQKVAEVLGINQETVSKMLRKAYYRETEAAVTALEEHLRRIGSTDMA